MYQYSKEELMSILSVLVDGDFVKVQKIVEDFEYAADLKKKTDKELGKMYLDTDIKFWHWVNKHYDMPTEETAKQMEFWRSKNYAIHDEMYSMDRIKRNGKRD